MYEVTVTNRDGIRTYRDVVDWGFPDDNLRVLSMTSKDKLNIRVYLGDGYEVVIEETSEER